MIAENPFMEIATVLSIATVLGVIGHKLRQPLIIMFLATGILAGPACLGIIQSHEQIDLLAQIGIALLLFIVGLKLDVKLIKTTGPVALATGIGQIIFTSIIGFGISVQLGMSLLPAAYVAVALTFSSTIIIVKLLSDKKDIDSLYGQIAIGFLIVQDIAAILALVGLTTLGSVSGDKEVLYFSAFMIVVRGIGMLVVILLIAKYVLPKLVKRLAHSLELLTLFAISWAVLLGAGGELLGFSKEVGAFLAGVSLASTEYRDALGSRLTTLRDFLLLFFFLDLGARLEWGTVGAQMGASILLSLFVLIGNPLIVLVIMGIMGYRRRTSFMAGLTVAQISEFSLIVVALGRSIGHISSETVGLVTLVGIVTICISTYMIQYSDQLYQWLANPLKLFEKRNPHREDAATRQRYTMSTDVILIGLNKYGGVLVNNLIKRGKSVLGVDYDPIVIVHWQEQSVPVIYGDINDPEMYDQLPLRTTPWIISTLRVREKNLNIVQQLKKRNYTGKIALAAANEKDAADFEQAGAQLVFRPFIDAAEQAVDALTYAMDIMPENVDWPVSFLEARIHAEAEVAGKSIRDIPLRTLPGINILAASRGGRVYFEPGPDFKIFPGDRVLIIGPPSSLKDAGHLLNQNSPAMDKHDSTRFEIAEIPMAKNSELAGKSLAELRFRQKYRVTLVGIRRGNLKITAINPSEYLAAGDCLIVIGTAETIAKLEQQAPL